MKVFLRDFGDVLGGKNYPGDTTHDEESKREESTSMTYVKETLVAKGRNAYFRCSKPGILH